MRRSRGIAASLALAAALTAAGCGGGQGGDVKDALRAYINAFADGDGKKACSLMTEATRQEVIARMAPLTRTEDCANIMDYLRRQAGPDVLHAYRQSKIEKIQVSGNIARATLRSTTGTTSTRLEKVDGDWKVAAVPGT